MRLIVGISGASGVIMGYQMLKALKQLPDMEVHLIITEGAVKNFECETNIEISRLAELADFTHSNKNLSASISSGSFVTDGMIIIPRRIFQRQSKETEHLSVRIAGAEVLAITEYFIFLIMIRISVYIMSCIPALRVRRITTASTSQICAAG